MSEWNTFGFEVFPGDQVLAAFNDAVDALPDIARRLEHDTDFTVLGLNQCLVDLG